MVDCLILLASGFISLADISACTVIGIEKMVVKSEDTAMILGKLL